MGAYLAEHGNPPYLSFDAGGTPEWHARYIHRRSDSSFSSASSASFSSHQTTASSDSLPSFDGDSHAVAPPTLVDGLIPSHTEMYCQQFPLGRPPSGVSIFTSAVTSSPLRKSPPAGHPTRTAPSRPRSASAPYPACARDALVGLRVEQEVADFLAREEEFAFPSLKEEPAEEMQRAGPLRGAPLGGRDPLEQLAANVRKAASTSATDKAKQAFVQAWLSGAYCAFTDGNISRQELYASYEAACAKYGARTVNAASFGKTVRACFPMVKTRRLGVRGASKYHYCGVHPAASAEVDALAALGSVGAQAWSISSPSGSVSGSSRADDDDDDFGDVDSSFCDSPVSQRSALDFPTSASFDPRTPTVETVLHIPTSCSTSGRPTHARGRPPRPVPVKTPVAPAITKHPRFPSVGPDSPAAEVWGWYASHCQNLVEAIRSYRFDSFEISLRTFLVRLNEDQKRAVMQPEVANAMAMADIVVYDVIEIISFIRSQTTASIPVSSLASLRQLAENMEQILGVSMEGFSQSFVGTKIELGARFGHLILRFLDLYQITQTLVSILSNKSQVNPMLEAWEKVDFDALLTSNQCALVCNCRHADFTELVQTEFTAVIKKVVLGCNEPVQVLMDFVSQAADHMLDQGLSPKAAIERFCFVTAQIIRDLTMRSEPSFGAFQILKLWADDRVAFKILCDVALAVQPVQEDLSGGAPADLPPFPAQLPPTAQMPNLTFSRVAASFPSHPTDFGLPPPSPHIGEYAAARPAIPAPAPAHIHRPPPLEFSALRTALMPASSNGAGDYFALDTPMYGPRTAIAPAHVGSLQAAYETMVSGAGLGGKFSGYAHISEYGAGSQSGRDA